MGCYIIIRTTPKLKMLAKGIAKSGHYRLMKNNLLWYKKKTLQRRFNGTYKAVHISKRII